MEEALVVERRDDAALVTINRPARMNALSQDVVAGLVEAFETLPHADGVRAIVLAGAGERAFCAGADLKERATMSQAEVRRFVAGLQRTMDLIANAPVPIIAAIDGYALGGGLELALACDLRLTTARSSIGLTETRLGIIPGAGGTQRLTRIVGIARAKELIYRARRVSGEEAVELGIANALTDPESLLQEALAWCADIAKSAPLSIAQAKFAIDRGAEVDLHSGLAIERKAYEVLIPTEDRLEALAAFRDKRPPVFKGR